MIIVFMGVAGAGKSTVGQLFAAELHCEFLDGTASNYALSSSSTFNPGVFASPSFTTSNSGGSLTGGQNDVYNTVYDTGTITATVNGTVKSVSYGSSSTPSSRAAALAAAFCTVSVNKCALPPKSSSRNAPGASRRDSFSDCA